MRYRPVELPQRIGGPAAARDFFANCFAQADPRREILWVAHVDEQFRCLHVSRHEGDEAGAILPLRTIIADAAIRGSARIILAHNHPSGDPRPSESDRRATRRLALAADALDCAVVDHLVFGGGEFTSFREMGLL